VTSGLGTRKSITFSFSVSGEDAQCRACLSSDVTIRPRIYVTSPYIFSGIIRPIDDVTPLIHPLLLGGGGGGGVFLWGFFWPGGDK
jgi:hypothetical protein